MLAIAREVLAQNLVKAPGQPRDLRPVVAHQRLRMHQVVAQAGQLLDGRLGYALGAEAPFLALVIELDQNLPLVRELQTIEQGHRVVPDPPAFFVQLHRHLEAAGRQQGLPSALWPAALDACREVQLDQSQHAEQPHAADRGFQFASRDMADKPIRMDDGGSFIPGQHMHDSGQAVAFGETLVRQRQSPAPS